MRVLLLVNDSYGADVYNKMIDISFHFQFSRYCHLETQEDMLR